MPGPASHRPPCQDERRNERPDGRRGPEHAEPGRPDVENVLGEHGQQRDRPAEQDGEEVE